MSEALRAYAQCAQDLYKEALGIFINLQALLIPEIMST